MVLDKRKFLLMIGLNVCVRHSVGHMHRHKT